VDGQIGLEETPEAHIERLVEVFREVRRCLHPTGTLFVNYGDAYATGTGGDRRIGQYDDTRARARKPVASLRPKNLLMMPFRLALALQNDGWILRSVLPWVKRSAMPESCTDRPSTALEYVFLLSKSSSYFWDADAVRRKTDGTNGFRLSEGRMETTARKPGNPTTGSYKVAYDNPNGRNLRNSDFYFDSLDLAIEQAKAELAHLTHLRERGGLLLSEEGEPLALDVNTEASTVDHFASFPRKLVQPLVQAGTSERGCCAECGAPWVRVTEKEPGFEAKRQTEGGLRGRRTGAATNADYRGVGYTRAQTLGWRKSCKCLSDHTSPCVVLDPFCGTGTVMVAASGMGRKSIGIDLKADYIKLSEKRNAQVSLLL
jgi:hypothetical protein